ncbi:MAG: hypothetical protein CUN55_01130 [Phototrophicales bacterium]|nr:MAG: hypothetical protein CUN55_01130 [Phototrophicales bacterium]
MSEEIRQAVPDAKRPSALGPLMGLLLAASLAVISYFAAPLLIDQLKANFTSFDEAIIEEDEALEGQSSNEDTITYVTAAFIWFTSFSLLMVLVSAVVGRDSVIEAERKTVHPRQDKMSPREAKKYYAKISKQRRQKIAALKKLKAKEEAKRRRGGK